MSTDIIAKYTTDQLTAARYRRGIVALHEGRLGDAEELFARLRSDGPSCALGEFGLGVVRAKQGQFHEAEQLLGSAVAAQPHLDICASWHAYARSMTDPRKYSTTPDPAPPNSNRARQPSSDLATVVARVRRSVVGITALDSTGAPVASGTGIVMNQKGMIATNAHVLHPGGSMTVTTASGAVQLATTLGQDQASDVALVVVPNSTELTPISAATVSPLAGDQVIAIGDALGIDDAEPSVSMGIVSAIHQDVEMDSRRWSSLIQTDAAISAGCSGGPLLNMRGELVGIITASLSEGAGINIAIPFVEARPILRQLQTGSSSAPVRTGPSGTKFVSGRRPGTQIPTDEQGPGEVVAVHRLPLRVLAAWVGIPLALVASQPGSGLGFLAMPILVWAVALWYRRRVVEYERMFEIHRGVIFRRIRPVWFYQVLAPPRVRENLIFHSMFGIRKLIIAVANPARLSPWRSPTTNYSITIGIRSGRKLFERLLLVQRTERTNARGVWVSE